MRLALLFLALLTGYLMVKEMIDGDFLDSAVAGVGFVCSWGCLIRVTDLDDEDKPEYP